MANFLAGLGAFAGGLAPGVDKLYEQQSGDALGKALADIYGGSPSPTGQSSAGPLGSIGSLLSGGAQPPSQAQAPMPQMTQAPQMPVAQMGARMPQPQNQAPPQMAQASPMPQQQPMPQMQPPVAQAASGGIPGGAAPQQQAATPQQQQAPPPPPQPQPQRQQPQQQGQPGTGPLDIPTLVRSLTQHGITGHKLVEALDKALPLYNAQGLQQYHSLGLQLRSEDLQNREADRRWNRDPTAQGSRAQNRTVNQGIAVQRLEGVQQRFETRMQAAAAKLTNARTDKQASEAKRDLDKIQSELKGELASELQIANGMNTSPEEQKAALAKAAEIRQQMESAVDAALQAHRSGGASGDQVGGVGGGAQPAGGGQDTAYGPDGQKMKYKGTGDRSDPANWVADSGG